MAAGMNAATRMAPLEVVAIAIGGRPASLATAVPVVASKTASVGLPFESFPAPATKRLSRENTQSVR
jgi:hypothetical protein